MLNLLLILIFIHSLFYYYLKPKNNSFYCGIFGYIGGNTRKFDANKFNILGLFNDERGGDACGRVIDHIVEHNNEVGFKHYKDYAAFFRFPKPEVFNTIIGHTRKASVGGSAIYYTQPFVIRNPKSMQHVMHVGAHNGTLYNHEELAKKYSLPKEIKYLNEKEELISHKMNDTQVLLTTLMSLKDYSILENYHGAASLVWHDRITNKSYLFRGESIRYSSAKTTEEERPLYIYSPNKKSHWFSSIEKSLLAISSEEDPVIEQIDSNTIYEFKDGELVDKIAIDRSKASQSRFYENNHNNTYNHNNKNSYVNRHCGYGNDYYDDDYYSGYPYNSFSSTKPETKNHLEEVNSLPPITMTSLLTIQYAGFKYWINREKAHGMYHLDQAGNIFNEPTEYSKKYCFYEGILLKEDTIFIELVKLIEDTKSKISSIDWSKDRILSTHARYPFQSYAMQLKKPLVRRIGDTTEYEFTSTFSPLFSRYTYYIVKGLMSRKETDTVINTAIHSPNPKKDGKYYYEDTRNNVSKIITLPEKTESAIAKEKDLYECKECGSSLDDKESICFCGGTAIKAFSWEICTECSGEGYTGEGVSEEVCSICSGLGLIPLGKDGLIVDDILNSAVHKSINIDKIREAVNNDIDNLTSNDDMFDEEAEDEAIMRELYEKELSNTVSNVIIELKKALDKVDEDFSGCAINESENSSKVMLKLQNAISELQEYI